MKHGDKYCIDCAYYSAESSDPTCEYIFMMPTSRGCPPGKDCTKKRTDISHKKLMKQLETEKAMDKKAQNAQKRRHVYWDADKAREAIINGATNKEAAELVGTSLKSLENYIYHHKDWLPADLQRSRWSTKKKEEPMKEKQIVEEKTAEEHAAETNAQELIAIQKELEFLRAANRKLSEKAITRVELEAVIHEKEVQIGKLEESMEKKDSYIAALEEMVEKLNGENASRRETRCREVILKLIDMYEEA